MMKKKKEIQKICKFCGKDFVTTSKIRQCCSDYCSHKYAALVTKQRNKNFKRVYNIDDMFLQKESAEKYYFLGLMASDGNIYSSTIAISQSGDNGKQIIEYVKAILNTDYKILQSIPKKGEIIYSLNMRSKQIINDLSINNIKPKKTFNFKIPQYILNDENKLKNFLIGYIDGDGSIGVYKNMLVISFVCNQMMFKQLMNNIIFKNARITDKGNVMEFRFNGINAVRFGEWLYDNINVYQSYKYKKYKNYIADMFDISERMKYNFLREKIFKALDENPNMNCMQYARENNLDFRYVYDNRKRWRKLNENSK